MFCCSVSRHHMQVCLLVCPLAERESNVNLMHLRRRFKNILSGRKFARDIFSAFWSGNRAYSAASLVYFPAWAKDLDFLKLLLEKSLHYEPSRWAVDSVVSSLHRRSRSDPTFIIPYANSLIHAFNLFNTYVHPNDLVRPSAPNGLWLEGDPGCRNSPPWNDRGREPWERSSSQPWEAAWRWKNDSLFWRKHGHSLPLTAVLAAVTEHPKMISEVRQYARNINAAQFRRSVRDIYRTLSDEQAGHIFRGYPEAVADLPIPQIIQKEQAVDLLKGKDVVALKKSVGSGRMNVLSLEEVMEYLAPPQKWDRWGYFLQRPCYFPTGSLLADVINAFIGAGWEFQADHIQRLLNALPTKTERVAFLDAVCTRAVPLSFRDEGLVKGLLKGSRRRGEYYHAAEIRENFRYAGFIMCLHRRDREENVTTGLIKVYAEYPFSILLNIGTEPLADHTSLLAAKNMVEEMTEDFVGVYMQTKREKGEAGYNINSGGGEGGSEESSEDCGSEEESSEDCDTDVDSDSEDGSEEGSLADRGTDETGVSSEDYDTDARSDGEDCRKRGTQKRRLAIDYDDDRPTKRSMNNE